MDRFSGHFFNGGTHGQIVSRTISAGCMPATLRLTGSGVNAVGEAKFTDNYFLFDASHFHFSASL